jgi:hypothetical protein
MHPVCLVSSRTLFFVALFMSRRCLPGPAMALKVSHQRVSSGAGFDSRPVRVGFVLDRVTLGLVSVGVLRFPPVSIIPLVTGLGYPVKTNQVS